MIRIEKIKEYEKYIYLALFIIAIISPILAYGLSTFIPFLNALALVIVLLVPTILWWKIEDDKKEKTNIYLENEVNRLQDNLDILLEDNNKMGEAIENYEQLLDSQMWEIECLCGDNTFVGILTPYSDNICVCEKCKNTYKITLNYDSVLVSEPLNEEELLLSLKTKSQSTKI